MNYLHQLADWFDDNGLAPECIHSIGFTGRNILEVVIPRWLLTVGEFRHLLTTGEIQYRQCIRSHQRRDIWNYYRNETGVFQVRIMEALFEADSETLNQITLVDGPPTVEVPNV